MWINFNFGIHLIGIFYRKLTQLEVQCDVTADSARLKSRVSNRDSAVSWPDATTPIKPSDVFNAEPSPIFQKKFKFIWEKMKHFVNGPR